MHLPQSSGDVRRMFQPKKERDEEQAGKQHRLAGEEDIHAHQIVAYALPPR